MSGAPRAWGPWRSVPRQRPSVTPLYTNRITYLESLYQQGTVATFDTQSEP